MSAPTRPWIRGSAPPIMRFSPAPSRKLLTNLSGPGVFQAMMLFFLLATDILVTQAFRYAFEQYRYGYAAAYSPDPEQPGSRA